MALTIKHTVEFSNNRRTLPNQTVRLDPLRATRKTYQLPAILPNHPEPFGSGESVQAAMNSGNPFQAAQETMS